LFAGTDAAARHYGWQVSATHRGFVRRYRDHRFDTLKSCGDCAGRGFIPPGASCRGCGGTGRITVRAAGEPPSDPSRGPA
jgi:RecJ-like exonuclease